MTHPVKNSEPTDERFGIRPTLKGESPATFLSDAPKFVFPYIVNDGYSFENCMFTREMLGERETIRRSFELSKENPMLRKARDDLAISNELKEMRRAEIVEQKRRQQLLTNSEDLRGLAENLKLASISKDLNERMLDFYKSPLDIERGKAGARQEAEMERLQYLCEVHQKELSAKEEQKKLSETLALQIQQNQERRKQEALQTLSDRQLSIILQEQIKAENKAMQIKLEQDKIRKREEMKRFLEDKNAYKESMNRQNQIELKKLLDNQSEIDERRRQLDQKRLELRLKREEISTHLGRQIIEIRDDKSQRHNLLLDLLESESNAKNEERFRQKMQQEILLRKQTKEELDSYRRQAIQRDFSKKEQKREELAARKAVAAYVEEEVKIEQNIAEHQRRKEHGAVILSLIRDNQRKRAEAMAENVQFCNMKAKAEKELQERVQQERFNMLNSVPASVLRYLPNYVLTDADRKYFGVQQRKNMGAGDA